MKTSVGLLLGLIFCLVNAYAELAPKEYREMQSHAPEAISIRVDRVFSRESKFLNFNGSRVETIEATVLAVTRSAFRLKAGDSIVIHYTHKKQRGAAPSPIPQLKKGNTYPAWLSKSKTGTYEPAARGFSFSRIGD